MTARKIQFSQDELALIRRKYMRDADDDDFEEMIARCEHAGLNPLLGQVHIQGRFDQKARRMRYSIQTTIDGFRDKAQNTGLYDGQDEPEYVEDPDGRLVACKVKVYRKDISRAFVGVAYLSEFVQPGPFWQRMARTMLAKCAEAIAFRKAFPGDFQKLYVPEEMGSDAAIMDDDDEDSRPRPKRATHAETLPSIEEITPPPPAVAGVPGPPPEEVARREAEYASRVGAAVDVDALKSIVKEASRKMPTEAFLRVKLACTDKRLALERLSQEAANKRAGN